MSLSRRVIVEVALRILRAEGLDALSMRRVAAELGTGPASLYAHVAHKTELLEALFDEVVGDVPLPEPDPGRWREQVTRLWTDFRDVMMRSRDLARATRGRVAVGPNSVRLAEATDALLLLGGVPAQASTWAVDVVGRFVVACSVEDPASVDGHRDERFRFGLDLLVGGLAALAPTAALSPPR